MTVITRNMNKRKKERKKDKALEGMTDTSKLS